MAINKLPKDKKLTISHYLNKTIKKGADNETPTYPVYLRVVFLRNSAQIRSLTNKYMAVSEFEALKNTDNDLLKELAFIKYYVENEWNALLNTSGEPEKFNVGVALKDFNLRLIMNTWSNNELPFQGQPIDEGNALPIIEMAQNFNNKLSAETSFVVLVPNAKLYTVGKRYQINLKGKPLMNVWLESKSTFSFDKITSFVARIDRGMELQAYKNAIRFEMRNNVDSTSFALLSLIIIRNTQEA